MIACIFILVLLGLLSYTHRETDQEKADDVAKETEWRRRQGLYVINDLGQPDPPHPADFDMRFDETVEIGLRSDGVLVWRKAETPTKGTP